MDFGVILGDDDDRQLDRFGSIYLPSMGYERGRKLARGKI